MTELELTQSEEALLCNFENEFDVSETSLHIQQLWQGNWEALLQNDAVLKILKNCGNPKDIHDVFKSYDSENEEIFCIGIASFLCFIQANFTGPSLSDTTTDFLSKHFEDELDFKKNLSIDGEEISVSVKHPALLILAKCIFENLILKKSFINSWWYLRYAMTHQHLLDDYSLTLFSNIEKEINKIVVWNIKSRAKAKLYLEISQIYLMFGMVNDSENYLESAKDHLGLDLELSGELGKRTKFQQKDVAQIVLRVTLRDGVHRPVTKESTIPDILKLDDDVRLDRIAYCNDIKISKLPITEQEAILATVQFMQRARPRDLLLLEESEAFLVNLLQHNNSWGIRMVSLLLRCHLESNHKRTIERSLQQLESLIDHLNTVIPAPIDRVSSVWSVAVLPKWKLEANLADLMINLGLVKASLDIYLRLHMWEEVIVCYTIMQLRHKATEIIKVQLEETPTPKLWCLLGDATDDVACFQKAWDISENKSSRAQRHWGQYLFAHKEFAESIPHLQKSLEINSLQNMVWLRLGYAALEVEDWKLAASAYRRYTSLEPGGFEAWNNLAKAYIKIGEKQRAHFALQEALKYSFDNWKIWDNFMVVSAATAHFSDVIRSYHQILDLKEKHLDYEVLFMLTKNCLTGEINEEDQCGNSKRMLTKARELFGRLTSVYPNDSRLWEMYADLSPSAEVKAQRLYRSYRGLVQDDWSKDAEKCGKVLVICRRLGEAGLESGSSSSLSSARLTLKAAVAAARKQAWDQHEAILQNVEDILQKILAL